MALSFAAVQKAYQVFNQLKNIIELRIPSWPDDMSTWNSAEKNNPEVNLVYGVGRKSDDGWENLLFFTENPSQELKDMFDQLKDTVPNSSISSQYERNERLWVFGWF